MAMYSSDGSYIENEDSPDKGLVDCGYNDCDQEMMESHSSRITFDHYVVFLCPEHYPKMLKHNAKLIKKLGESYV
jgi:hypothetical protein